MAENSSRRRISISFTLPISCQICLGKVKQPIVCPNHHVFCSVCIELWLQHNQQCPTCRVPITPENPCKQILGGQTQDGESDSYMSNPALRRTRFDILYQDFEREIKRLEQENELLQNSNCQLQLIAAEKLVASRSELISNPISTRSSSASSPGSKPKFTCTPSPRPSPFGFKWKSKQEKCDLFSSSECNGGYSGDDAGNGEMLAVLRSKLKQATSLYDKIKQDMEKLKETNLKLSADKRTLLAETGRLKQAASARSPYKYEKYTSMAQQSKLEQYRREVSQLKSALERSDAYINELETKLEGYKLRYSPLLQESSRTQENYLGACSKKSNQSENIVTVGIDRDTTNKFSDGNLLSISSGRCFNPDVPPRVEGDNGDMLILFGKRRCQIMAPVDTNDDPSESSDKGRFTDDAYRNYVKNKNAGSVRVPQKQKHGTVSAVAVQQSIDDTSDLDETEPVIKTTPSTALGRLSLGSSQKSQRSLSSFEESISHNQSKISPSCHRHLDFGKERSKDTALLSVSNMIETKNQVLHEDNLEDVGPLDQNATFSDLNFTMTSEFSDCARLMKNAEIRVKNKRLNNLEVGDAGCLSQVMKSKDDAYLKSPKQETDKLANEHGRKLMYSKPIICIPNDGKHKDFASNRGDDSKSISLHNKCQMDLDSGNTQVIWSDSKPQYRFTPQSVSAESTEPANKMSSSITLTSTRLIRTSQSFGGNSKMASFPCTETEQPRTSYTAATYQGASYSAAGTKMDCCHPAIKPQLKLIRHLDTPEYKTCMNDLGTGSRFKFDKDSDRNACTFDFLCNKPFVNNKTDKVISEGERPSRSDQTVQSCSGVSSANETEIKQFLPGHDRQGTIIKESRKRIGPNDCSSPSKSFKF